eukprot:TRINITY_DN2708_c1_g1_i1.p1 TRINITY_DN2708_c1_g1~~TRINITY_DN2708_c1_g1_i1.p1  ORF type:complete len:598 (-),score=200.61 TRINITY_DN2708_c1_g1_i1:282-2024(-)
MSKFVIVGGVAGGASAAARLRRMNEDAEVIMVERGPFVSFSNCGLPYYVGDVVPQEGKLLVSSPDMFRCRFNIDCRINSEVISVDAEKRVVRIKKVETGEEYDETYTDLVLSPGAAPSRPSAIPGIMDEAIMTVRTVPDARQIKEFIAKHNAKRAVVIGAGFIGLEVAENLKHLEMDVTVLEYCDQVFPGPVDWDMAAIVERHLESNGIKLRLGEGISGFERTSGDGLLCKTSLNKTIETDLVILAIGVRPESELATMAGCETGMRGAIKTNEFMQTNIDHIYALGDAILTTNYVTGEETWCALAGPANRQGRVAADVISGMKSKYRGPQGTYICGLFGMTVAGTGLSETACKKAGIPHHPLYVFNPQHVAVIPGAKQMNFKVLFNPENGKILGAHAVGVTEGIEKRIDVMSVYIQMKAHITALADAELCYAPQFNSPRDPVNMIGMISQNIMGGLAEVSKWDEIESDNVVVLDVRNPGEFDVEGKLPFANVFRCPVCLIRDHMDKLPKDKPIHVLCREGQRAYFAARILTQNGFDNVKFISGGYFAYRLRNKMPGPIGSGIGKIPCIAYSDDIIGFKDL